MNTDDPQFEQWLKAQTIRKMPGEWRSLVLQEVTSERVAWARKASLAPWLSGGVLACWVLIFALQGMMSAPPQISFEARDNAEVPLLTVSNEQSYQLAMAYLEVRTTMASPRK